MNASDLVAAGWKRVFVEKTKYGNDRYVWRRDGDRHSYCYFEAMTNLIDDIHRENGTVKKPRKKNSGC